MDFVEEDGSLIVLCWDYSHQGSRRAVPSVVRCDVETGRILSEHADGLTAVMVVSKNTTGLPVAWTVLPQTTFDGLVTAAYWSFAGMTVDSSRDRWAYGTPGGLGIVPVAPTVTFGGQTIYFDTINTAQVGLNLDDGPSPRQPRIAVTNVASREWKQVVWSREVWIADYETSTGMAKLTTGYDVVGWTFLSVICRTTDKNVHPTPIRRSCSRWSTPRCGSRWNWPSRYRMGWSARCIERA